MNAPDHDEPDWSWLELGPIESLQRYVLGLEAEREGLRDQGRYMRRQLAALAPAHAMGAVTAAPFLLAIVKPLLGVC